LPVDTPFCARHNFFYVIRQALPQSTCFRKTQKMPHKETESCEVVDLSLNSIVGTFARPEKYQMDDFKEKVGQLFKRIPRRHTSENVKELYNILNEYEDLLMSKEADVHYEKQIARFFEVLDPIRATIKKSNDNKASKRSKDVLFDEASGALKDTMEELMQL
jgi:hypothetical protein